MTRTIARNAGVVAIGAALVAGYWLLTDVWHVLDPFLFAGPAKVYPAFVRSLDKLAEGFVSSLTLLVPAYVLAVVLGVGVWLGAQSFINLGVNTALLPTKGLTLPFMSFGGSGIIANCIGVALLFRIDWEHRQMMRGKTF